VMDVKFFDKVEDRSCRRLCAKLGHVSMILVVFCS
jgi:hypothetical protein